MPGRSPATDAFWAVYRRHAGLDHDGYEVVAFGDHAALGRIAARLGVTMHEGIKTVFERFRVVWPPEIADRD